VQDKAAKNRIRIFIKSQKTSIFLATSNLSLVFFRRTENAAINYEQDLTKRKEIEKGSTPQHLKRNLVNCLIPKFSICRTHSVHFERP
jgi:hypothetical protein